MNDLERMRQLVAKRDDDRDVRAVADLAEHVINGAPEATPAELVVGLILATIVLADHLDVDRAELAKMFERLSRTVKIECEVTSG